MTNTFSVLSLKRNRSNNTTKESKFNSILNKLANSFNSHKKRKPYEQENINRRSSISALFDYFRSSEDSNHDQHPFANDALFEHNRYKQQKQSNQTAQQQINTQPTTKPSSILIKSKPAHIHHRHTQSAITARSVAARKKKSSHIRHYSHVSCISSSNITVNSEDLTAKEFADIAGIRILSEDDDQPVESQSGSKICTFCGTDETELPSLIVTSSRISNNSIIRSSNSSVYNSEDEEEEGDEPQIWDDGFWQKPGTSSSTIEPPPILHELRRYQDTYIKKGRFEIHLSPNTNIPKNNKKPETVVEWKRKSRPSSLKRQII